MLNFPLNFLPKKVYELAFCVHNMSSECHNSFLYFAQIVGANDVSSPFLHPHDSVAKVICSFNWMGFICGRRWHGFEFRLIKKKLLLWNIIVALSWKNIATKALHTIELSFMTYLRMCQQQSWIHTRYCVTFLTLIWAPLQSKWW